MYEIKQLTESIKKNEGFSGTVYKCSEGFDTLGFGTKMPLTTLEAELLLKSRLTAIADDILFHKPLIRRLPLFKQAIIFEMAYQMGVNGVLKFEKMFKALDGGFYALASKEMLNSKWASQTPDRAKTLALRMASTADDASFDVVN